MKSTWKQKPLGSMDLSDFNYAVPWCNGMECFCPESIHSVKTVDALSSYTQSELI